MVSFRLPVDTYTKILTALDTPSNGNSSVSDYCKQTVVRHAWRHDKKKRGQG